MPLFLGGLLGTGTFEPQLQSTATSVVRDIALVLDRSGSMASQNKINDLKAAVNIFLDILQATPSDERVSLDVLFHHRHQRSGHDQQLESDSVRGRSNGRPTALRRSAKGCNWEVIVSKFDPNSRPFAEKTIVLLTDGIENRGPFTMPVLNGILPRGQVIHTITFGAGADQNLMRQRGVADRRHARACS